MDDRPARATIHLSAIRANFSHARKLGAGVQPIAVVKADAYGHGAVPVARALVEAGCGHFAVATVPEAESLRNAGIREPILVLGGVSGAEEAEAVVARELVAVVHHRQHLEWLAAAARTRGTGLPVQVEIDTGMHRMGVPADEFAPLLAAIVAEPALRLDGVYTHFARADEIELAPTLEQLAIFRGVVASIDPAPRWIHAANSAGILAGEPIRSAMPELTASRPGLMLYGVSPAPHFAQSGPQLAAAMTLSSRVVALRSVRAGDPVGYSAEFRATSDTRIATIAIGYEDGVPIATGGSGQVSIAGRRLPIVGRVSMDYIGVDVGRAAVEIGDEAILFGPSPVIDKTDTTDTTAPTAAPSLTVEQAARAANTIPYELLVRVGQRVVRDYRE